MIGLVYLAWAPLGPEEPRRFLASYREHDAGAEHELVVLLNGVAAASGDPAAARAEVLGALHEVPHRVIEVDPPRIDLAAYGEAARRLEHSHLCFLNSYAEVLVDGWLGHLERALAQPGVAMAGATGSWESLSDWRRGTPAHNLYDLVRLPWLRRLYPRFPNPHLRTSTFLAARERLGALGLERVRDKPSAYRLESGVSGIIPQLRAAGERAVVVDRDGIAHEEEDWPASRTFRSGDQERLLVADNQTRLYDAASPQERRRLSANAWGQAR